MVGTVIGKQDAKVETSDFRELKRHGIGLLPKNAERYRREVRPLVLAAAILPGAFLVIVRAPIYRPCQTKARTTGTLG
jgi:hypothetical protein